MNNSHVNKKRSLSLLHKMSISIIMGITGIISMTYMLTLYLAINKSNLYTADIILFIKIFELVLAMLAVVSCMLCYNSSKKQELFIVSLMYIVFFIDILLGNLDSMSLDVSKININNYISVATSLIRISILIISISRYNKIKDIIINNKIKAVSLVIIVSLLLGMLKINGIINDGFKDTRYFIGYNLFLIIIYIIVSITYLVKSIKDSEYIYSVISASMFLFVVKAVYAIYGANATFPNIKLLSISISYMGFIVLIGGIVCELLLNVKQNKKLENELYIFKKIVAESRLSSIAIYDENENIVYINNEAKKYFDIRDKNNYEELNREINNIFLDVDKEIKKDMKNHLLQLGYWKGILELNNEVVINCSIQNMYIDDVKRNVLIFNDISENIKTKKALIEYEKLKSQEQIRQQFFANISHELRTPLNIFYSTIQLLDLKSSQDSEQLKETYLNHKQCLKTNCQRMLRLINNIVDITKIDTGFIKPKFVNSDIVRLVEDITLSVINYAQNKNINIEFDTQVEEHIIKCDEDMLERIMLNLLSNAIKFTNQNGNISVDIYIDEKWVHINVKDDGIGIPLEVQGEIFDRFVQSDKSLTRLNEGSGIGLSLVKSCVELHNGEIYLDSEEDCGTEFEILVPNEKLKNCKHYENMYKVTNQKVELELSDIYELYD